MSLKTLVRTCNFFYQSIPLREHYHDEYELIYVKAGQARLQVEKKDYSLLPGTLAVLSRQEDHRLYGLSSDYQHYFVLINATALDILITHYRLTAIFRNRPASFSHIYDLSSVAQEIESRLEKMVSEFKQDDEHSQILFSYYLQEILIYTFRLYPEACLLNMSEIDEEILRIQEFIDRNCFENIKIAEIAAKHFVSPEYLSTCFKRRTGYSPKQYLTKTRFSLAKSLLLSTSLPVQTICYKCGFSDVNNFIRLFKKNEGVSPNTYRRLTLF